MSPDLPTTTSSAAAGADGFRPWFLAATVALFVARPLLPSEGAIASGDALMFDLLPLVIAAAWALRACMRRGTAARYGLIDAVVILWVGWTAVSAAVAMRTGAPRPAVNAAWQAVSLATLLFLVRQLVQGEREVRACAAVMIGLAVALSGFGFQQFFYSVPRDQAAYERDPEAALREARVFAPPGSRQRELFENRLRSSEPMATFALANSLAGFLAPWLIVAGGICATALVLRCRDPWMWLPAVLVATTIAACLILTKSRAAVLATLFGAVALAGWTVAHGARLSLRLIAGAAILVALLVAAALVVGAVDRQVLTEAGKSLGYRWQYWQATSQIIRAHPWVGCGPGQFQTSYTRYKLTEASETVADPHNFLLEIWATTGTPAVMLFVVAIALVAWRVARRPAELAEPLSPHDNPSSRAGASQERRGDRPTGRDRRSHRHEKNNAARDADATLHVLGSGLVGFLVAFLIGPLAAAPLSLSACIGGMLVCGAVIAALYPWVRKGRLPVFVLALASAVLLVNLLAAGGITFAGVASTLWLLAGLCLALVEPWRRLSTIAAAMALVAAATMTGCFYVAVYKPVMASNLELARADSQPDRAEMYLRAAAVADPLSADPLRRITMLEWMTWRQYPSEERFARVIAALDGALALDPNSAALAEFKGDVSLEAFQRAGQAEALSAAVQSYTHAAVLYPTNILGRAKLAFALAEAGEGSAAAAAAVEALRLNEITPHADQKLPGDMVDRLKLLAGR